MTVHLLDANVLIALSYQGHEHHSLPEATNYDRGLN